MQGGKKINEQVERAINIHDRVLLILSAYAIESRWVKTEIAKARQREIRENRRVLFPLRLVEYQVLQNWQMVDADTGSDSAAEIREYFIPDFSNWKEPNSYRAAFDGLLRDLQQNV